MPNLTITITYTFRSPRACCAVVAREDVEYSGPHDLEGHHAFTGGVECHGCFLIVCSDCLPHPDSLTNAKRVLTPEFALISHHTSSEFLSRRQITQKPSPFSCSGPTYVWNPADCKLCVRSS